MNSFFSIVVPVYNREALITRCIDSIINQDFGNWELVIVDDGSTDETRNVILSYDDERVSYIYKENDGASSARNVALNNANGEYIAFLDSDDEYKPDHLSAIHAFLADNDFPSCLVCTDFIMNYDGKIVPRETSKFLTTKPNFTNLPYTQATAIHKDAIGQERFNEDLVIREDAEFLDRIRNKVDCYRVENKSVILHRHDDSITGNSIFVKKEMEKSIYYYIRTRKRITMKEVSKLFEIYNILSLHYFREKESNKLFTYVIKTMLLSPVCLFHYPSLKATFNRTVKLLRQN